MYRLLFLSSLLLFALVACSSAALAPSPMPARADTPAPSPSAVAVPAKTIRLIANRGGAGLAAENTLAGFRVGIAFNADFLEMDVHLTKDGIPIVMHDPTIDRTTDGKGRIADMTLAELGRFSTHTTSMSYREPIPTLAQVLDLTKSKNVQLEVAIKVDADNKRYPGIEQKVLDELAARDMLDRARILAFEFDTLKQVRAINPRVKTIALMSVDYFRSKGR
jgi:glycerophosphoryl diester phosphodiesterase